MRTVHELNSNELDELREAYFDQLTTMGDDDVLGDIERAEQLTDEDVKVHYEGMMFTDDDFFCNL